MRVKVLEEVNPLHASGIRRDSRVTSRRRGSPWPGCGSPPVDGRHPREEWSLDPEVLPEARIESDLIPAYTHLIDNDVP